MTTVFERMTNGPTSVSEYRRAEFWVRVARLLWNNLKMRRGLIFGLILVLALASFEVFNFSTTDYALTSLLGNLEFAGMRWGTILAIAFCAIDFAGLARLFTPERGQGHSVETWYLLSAWFLGATMNAMMTWWAVSLAMVGHEFGNEVLSREQLLAYVPVFVAALVWLTRILIIGTFSVAGERIFSQAEEILLQARNEMARTPAQFRPAPKSMKPQQARFIGNQVEDDEDPFIERQERAYRPPVSPRAVNVPPPVVAFRPSTTRPAPKPGVRAPQPANRNGSRDPGGNAQHN